MKKTASNRIEFEQFVHLDLGMFHVTKAGNGNLCRVVGWLRGEKSPSREAGPPEQPQHSLRRPLAQPRSAVAPKNNSRPSRIPFFRRAAPPTTREQPTHHEFPHNFDSYIAIAPPRVGLQAASAHPTDSKSDKLLAGAGRKYSGEGACRRSPRWLPMGFR